MRVDLLDRRVPGALRFRDGVTKAPILSQLTVESPGVRFVRNPSNLYVVCTAPGLEEYVRAFKAPPDTPVVESLEITVNVRDPARRYLPRQVRMKLPRDPDPQHAAQASSLFQPQEVTLYPAPNASIGPGWAVIRASIRDSRTPARALPGALLRVLRNGSGDLLATGLTNRDGEALVAVAGLPVMTWDAGAGPVLISEIGVTLEAYYDAKAPELPNPDTLEDGRAALPVARTPSDDANTLKLASGRVEQVTLTIDLS